MRTFNVAILLCFFHLSFAKNLVLETEKDNILIGEYVEYFQADRSLEFKEAIQSNLWQQSQAEVLNFGSTSKAIWIKLTVENRSTDDLFYLELNMPYLDHFELFQKDQNGKYSSEVVGDIYRFKSREVAESLPVHRLNIVPNSTAQYYLKIYSDQSVFLPLKIAGVAPYYFGYSRRVMFFGILTGIFGLVFVYCTFLFVQLKDPIFKYYGLYIISVYFTQAIATSNGLEHFFQDSEFLSEYGLLISTTALGYFALKFVPRFLGFDVLIFPLRISFSVLRACYFIQPLLVITGNSVLAFMYINILFMFTSIYIIICAFWSLKHETENATYLIVAWTIFIIGSILYTSNNLGLIPYSPVVNYTMPVGAAIETLMLVFVMGARVKGQVVLSVFSRSNTQNIIEENMRLKRKFRENGTLQEYSSFNPHFVFNVLSSTHGKMVKEDKTEIAEFLQKTSEHIRWGLNLSRRRWIRLDEEIAFVKEMVLLETQRTKKMVLLDLHVDERIDSFYTKIPSLVTQPIVENSLKYSNVYDHRNIRIEIVFEYINEELIVCTIMDDGPGLAKTKERKFKDERKSYGLEILEEKLRSASMVEEKSLINLIDRSDGDPKSTGVIVKIQIPTR